MKFEGNLNASVLCKGRLRKSLSTITHLIEKGNDDLWPLFEKLESELVRLEERQNRLSKYSKLS